jgi:hypothetical protein
MDVLPYARIEKLRPTESPKSPAGDPATYPYGRLCDTGDSLPVGYTLVGWLLRLPKVNEAVMCLRRMRNGIICLGIFSTSRVTRVEDACFGLRAQSTASKLSALTPDRRHKL